MHRLNEAFLDLISQDVTIDIEILNSLVGYGVNRYISSNVVITVKD